MSVGQRRKECCSLLIMCPCPIVFCLFQLLAAVARISATAPPGKTHSPMRNIQKQLQQWDIVQFYLMKFLFKRPIPALRSFKSIRTFQPSQRSFRTAQYIFNMGKRELFDLPQFDPTFKVDTSSSGYRPIVWVDCEMTGLDVANDHIIEVACLITDGDLNLVDEGYESVVHYDESVMNAMNEWCIEHHGDVSLMLFIILSSIQCLTNNCML